MSPTTEPIRETLLKAGLVHETSPETSVPESPWYVKALMGFSGWLAAVFLLGFIGVGFSFVFKNTAASFIVGGMMIGGAYALLRIPRNDFVEHLGLAFSLAGQVLVIYALIRVFDHSHTTIWLSVALLQILLVAAMPNFVHGVCSSFVGVIALYMILLFPGWPYMISGLMLFLAAWCFLHEFDYPGWMKKMRAVGYGLVMALMLMKGTALFGFRTLGGLRGYSRLGMWTGSWIGEILTGAVMVYAVWHVLRRYNQGFPDRLFMGTLVGTLLLCLVSLKVQGITVGIVIILLGFLGGNYVLLGLGVTSLLFYISAYYYLLDATLLAKSGTLIMVGLTLLIIRWLMLHLWLGKEEGGGARA